MFSQNYTSSMASQEPKDFHWYFADDYKGLRFHSRVLLLSVSFFIFVLFVNMLFLYGQWLCRRRSAAHGGGLVSGSQSSYSPRTEEPADCRHGLEAVIIDSFPIILFGSLGDSIDPFKESECSICLGVFQKEEKVKVLPRCRHAYHAECVDEWLRTQSSCPLCRASLRIDPLDESAIP